MGILYQDLGSYYQGFFVMTIDKILKDGINSEDFTTEELATFIHEYIHFMQNISTTFGVTYFNYISKKIQIFVSEAYNFADCIQIPIKIENVENAYEASELQTFYSGSNEYKVICNEYELKFEHEEIIEEEIKEDVKCANIYLDNTEHPYTFGAKCVEESMAYLIEAEKFNAGKRKNELPYNACELVCEKLCPTIVGHNNIIVALAEISLMHDDPGMMFCTMLQMIDSKNLVFKTTSDVYSYFKNKTTHLYENLSEQYKETKSTLDFLYPAQPELPFKECNEFLRNALYNGFKLRHCDRLFISKIMDLNEAEKHGYIFKLFNLLGLPPIIDKNNDVYSSGVHAIYMLVPIAVYNQFNSVERKCYMYNICKGQNLEQFSENNCENEPLKQTEKEKLCPFAAFSYYYSLGGKTINK